MTTLLDDPAIWRDRIERLLPFVDLVKVSQEDILLLFPNSSPEVVARGWLKAGPSVVVVTNGAKSVHAFRPNSDIEAAPPVVDVVDTVGAGEAFQAVLLTCLMHPADGIVPVASISDAALRTALNQATQASAETCRRVALISRCEPRATEKCCETQELSREIIEPVAQQRFHEGCHIWWCDGRFHRNRCE